MTGMRREVAAPMGACAVVPGIMSLKRDGTRYVVGRQPVPHAAGPICEPCWIEHHRVWPVGHRRCHHGGAA